MTTVEGDRLASGVGIFNRLMKKSRYVHDSLPEKKSPFLYGRKGDFGSPYGNRTRVTRMKIWCPNP